MKVLLARHGETIFNRKRILQGLCDSPLTDKGIDQARRLGVYLRQYEIDHAFSSDLRRAAETAMYALEGRDVPFTLRKELREMDFGDMEGDPIDGYHRERYYTGYHEWHGESKEDCGKRVMDFVLSLYPEYADKTILILSHGWAIRSFLRMIDQKRSDGYFDEGNRTKNCSFSSVRYDGKQFVIDELFKDVIGD